MDIYDFESSEEDDQENDNHSSSGGCKTGTDSLSADHNRTEHKKSKTIRKNYEPIKDGNIHIRYEDNPLEYKKLRKKIQNRESAARVRGRNKGSMIGLEVEVENLKKANSELRFINLALETENKSLKNEIEFLRGIVKPNFRGNEEFKQADSIDKYLNLGSSSTESHMKEDSEPHYESPFNDDDSALNWVRSSYSSGPRSNWSTILVLTIIVCVLVLPENSSENSLVIAKQTGTSLISRSESLVLVLLQYGKVLLKYLIIIGYIYYASTFIYSKYIVSKWKKV